MPGAYRQHLFFQRFSPKLALIALRSVAQAGVGMPEVTEMQKKFLIRYVIFVHLFLLVVLVKSDFITLVGYRLCLIKHVGPKIIQHFKWMVRYYERMGSHVLGFS
jgi:hypothetical protein